MPRYLFHKLAQTGTKGTKVIGRYADTMLRVCSGWSVHRRAACETHSCPQFGSVSQGDDKDKLEVSQGATKRNKRDAVAGRDSAKKDSD